MLEEDCLEETVIQSWRCNIDIFETRLGIFNNTNLLQKLEFIERVHSPPDAEPLLRRLLAQWGERESSSSNSDSAPFECSGIQSAEPRTKFRS
jgi:hypothetical protein